MDYIQSLNNVMSFALKKREVITNNITNQNTANFKAETVHWNQKMNEMKQGLRMTNEKHIAPNMNNASYQVNANENLEVNSNGNSVDMNHELIEMVKANQVTSLAVQVYNSHSAARSAARGN